MLASERWAKAFMSYLECAKCRKKTGLKLYGFDKQPIDVVSLSIEDLKDKVTRMDVWCENCEPRVNYVVQGRMRREHKDEAAIMADIVTSNKSSKDDEFILADGGRVTRRHVIEYARSMACQNCGQQYLAVQKKFVYINPTTKVKNVESMDYAHWTMDELLEEIQKCTVVCANCKELVEHGIIRPPKKAIAVDEAFLKGLAHFKHQF